MSETIWPVSQEREILPKVDDSFVESSQNFISELSTSIVGYQTPTGDYCGKSKGVKLLLELLENVYTLTGQFKPIVDAGQRFGNKSFQHLLEHLEQNADSILLPISELLAGIYKNMLMNDVKKYFLRSFGNEIRIDYGTGHELSFACLVKTLYENDVFGKDDLKDVYCSFFKGMNEWLTGWRLILPNISEIYFKLIRHMIKIYNLEPAGSKGVWGLDDYQFLPFIFGASQLQIQTDVSPENAIEQMTIEMYKETYMYIEALEYITSCKRGAPFYECSPMLYDISGIKSWKKIYVGLVKMYRDHVLCRNLVVKELNSREN